MKTVNIFLIASLLTVFGSCSFASDESEADYTEAASPVLYQTITKKGGAAVTFLVGASWGNSCGSFSRAEIHNTGAVYTIKIFGKEPRKGACAAVMSSFRAPVTIELPMAGTYRFKFWQSDSSAIDTTFTIK